MPDGPPSRRRGVGGFVVAVVVVVCLAMLGAVWAQKNLGLTLGTKPPPPAPTVDPRVAGFLTTGEKALSDGNLDSAKESFDKASALSEKDPHVLLGIARLAAARADELWLKSRLLPADAADDHRLTRERLSEMGMGARRAADDALTAQPEDPAAFRAKIDALRISGDREGARALVAKINASAAQPETAYVLAALDLAEVEPLWPTVIDRLKTAASAETGPGRARAALVFALARSGDGAGAKAEVDRLAAMPRVHPLLPLLRAFADKTKPSPSAKLDAGLDGAIAMGEMTIDAGKGLHGPVGPGGGGMPTDVRELVAQGEKARVKGDYERAKTLFTAAVDKNPNDSEALSGLASIAYAQRDLNGARASYKRVLAINPNYMPALVGLADVEWESGDKAGATKMYKDIIDRYPEGAYPARIKQRAEGG
jgi:tetratricopeptide (TPR) repeat protein